MAGLLSWQLSGSSWWKLKCLFICHSNTCSIGTSFYFMWCVCMFWVSLLVVNNAFVLGFCHVLILWMACDANQLVIFHTQQDVTLSWWQEIWLWGLNMYMIRWQSHCVSSISKSDDDNVSYIWAYRSSLIKWSPRLRLWRLTVHLAEDFVITVRQVFWSLCGLFVFFLYYLCIIIYFFFIWWHIFFYSG